MSTIKHNKKQELKQVIIFILTTALVSLLCAILIIKLPLVEDSLLYYLLFGIEAAGPSLAAILVIVFQTDRHSLERFLVEKYTTPFKFSICIIALLAPMVLYATAKAISVVFTPQLFSFTIQLPGVKKLLIIAWALVAEELGWRGFLQERIERFVGSLFTPLVVGIVFWGWHFHFYLTGAMDVPFWALLIGCVFESYGYYIIVKMSEGNVIPASIWHFSGNLFIYIFALNPDANHGNILPYVIAQCTLSLYFFAYFVFRRYGKNRYFK